MSPLSEAAPSGAKPPFIKPDSKKKNKKPGRKAGHKGVSRKRPDESQVNNRQTHQLAKCPKCHTPFEKSLDIRKRFIIDIVVSENPEVTEHTIHSYWCKTCKAKYEPAVPDAFSNFCIGIKTAVYSAYLHYAQGLSIDQVRKNLKIMGLELSPASLVNSWNALARQLTPLYNQIREEIRTTSEPIYADETGHRENGRKHWLWLFCTKNVALFTLRPKRSSEVVLEILGKSFSGILVTDFWKPYLAVSARFRQWCLAHFLREFKKIENRITSPPEEYWAFKKKIERLFRDAFRLARSETATPEERLAGQKRFLKRLDKLVAGEYTDKEVLRLVKRLKKYRDGFFTFVVEQNVDATNNHAERTLRFAVINRKVQFHTMSAKGSATMEVLISIFKTLELQGKDLYQETLKLTREAIVEEKLQKLRSAA